jgi:hypothetical protein
MNPSVTTDGFAIIPEVLAPAQVERLRSLFAEVTTAGQRGILELAEIQELAEAPEILRCLQPYFATRPFPVRGIFFDKNLAGAAANWLVPWHQDRTIVVQAKTAHAGFGPWSVKDGRPHVQPPAAVLESMLTIRLHLDPTDSSNGALRVLPGTHRSGFLSSAEISLQREQQAEFICEVSQGAALLMRPLLLHASGRSTSAVSRRVIHLEYASEPLPPGLDWAVH